MCFRLSDECNILQSEISAINRAVKWLRYYKIYSKDNVIATDSKAVRSFPRLSHILKWDGIVLHLIREHGTCTSNITADGLARNCASLETRLINLFCGIPFSACKHRINAFLINKHNSYRLTNIRAPELYGLPLIGPKLASFYCSQGQEVNCSNTRILPPHWKSRTTTILEFV